QPARNCFLGVMNDCRTALTLGQSPDPVDQWHPSAAERRALVSRSFAEYFSYSDHGARKPALQSCRAGSDSACTELLRSLPAGAVAEGGAGGRAARVRRRGSGVPATARWGASGRVGRRADPTDSGTPASTGARRPVACGKPGAAAPRVSQATPARIAATARERRAWSGAANRVIRVARTARPRTGETRSG